MIDVCNMTPVDIWKLTSAMMLITGFIVGRIIYNESDQIKSLKDRNENLRIKYLQANPPPLPKKPK